MRVSLSACLIGALCLATSVTARPPPEAAETTDPDCLKDFTYDTIAAAGGDFVYSSRKYATTSAGYICCDLCHRSNNNCMWAIWNNKTEECEMSINTDEDMHGWLGVQPTDKQRDRCPLGVWQEGLVQDRVYHESRYYVGPCWNANDWRSKSIWPGWI
jgi:hypothetical protein